ncbi:restriction endonuclease subunit S [Alistipes communis]|uniref:restriction endonuclease subunit S n=1 Tax=Alistipes communis TaxID=2585118 RepID=UPI003AF82656
MIKNNYIPQGYKQTELGIIPEEWEVVKLGNLGVTYTGLSGKRKCDFGWGSAKYIPFLNILNNPQIDIDDLEYVNIMPNEVQNAVQNGDLFFNTSSETPEEVGMCSVLTDKIENTYLNSFCFGYRLFDNNGAIGIFLSYYFRSAIGRVLMSILAQGATRYNLAKTTFLESTIALPPIKEQRRIVEALSDVDALIAALDKKIAKKRLIKQGAMQQLLTGKKRLQGFKGDIQRVTLSELGRFVSGNGFPLQYQGDLIGDYPFYKVSDFNTKGNENYLNISNNYITKDIANNLKCNIIPKNSIVFAKIGAAIFLERKKICLTDCCIDNNIMSFIPNENIDALFVCYFLRTVSFGELVETTALPSLGIKALGEIIVNLPSTVEEQRAIAKTLLDMDKEIADLEVRRDKYKLIKSGMMQKLLTGQIRLVKPLAPIIPLETPDAQIREIPLQTHVVAGHIVNALYQSSGWGRTKLQKTLHLVGYHCQLDFGNDYIRNTAGPDDQTMMNHIDSKFKQYRHVRIEVKKENGKTRYNYIPTAMIDELEQVYETYPQTIRHAVDSLINKIKKMDLTCAEIVSTLYAVWNNRIIKGEPISDDLLLEDFYAWSKHKLDFSPDQVLCELNYMRKEEIIPIGWGKYIDKK